jgi:hypothetical protein
MFEMCSFLKVFKIPACSCFQYQNPDITRRDVINTMQHYKSLIPYLEPFGKYFHHRISFLIRRWKIPTTSVCLLSLNFLYTWWGSSVSVVTRLWAGQPGIDSQQGK